MGPIPATPAAELMEYCRALLVVQGLLTNAESQNVKTRIKNWLKAASPKSELKAESKVE
jgi:hypothetical protein